VVLQETQTRDGLMKMKSVYEANSALGDPMSIEGQLNDSGHRLDKLRQEHQKFVGWLEEAEGKGHLLVRMCIKIKFTTTQTEYTNIILDFNLLFKSLFPFE
jgi:hypothetical protein